MLAISAMTEWRWTRAYQVICAAILAASAIGACRSRGAGGGFNADTDSAAPESGAPEGGIDDSGKSLIGNQATLTSITLSPPAATIESLNGAAVSQAFTATAH